MEFREDVSLGMKRPLSVPLMNGAGCCKTVEHVRKLSRSLAGAIVVGSFTKDGGAGNEGNVWWVGSDSGVGLNSLGMPNGGSEYLTNHLHEMVDVAHDAGKALVVNVAGSSPNEYALLTILALERGADAVELNMGCPNVLIGHAARKPIASFNLKVMEQLLSLVDDEIRRDAAIWVKVSPYSDPELLRGVAAVVLRYPVVKAVTAINTFPNAYGLENGKSVITVGLAGLSGRPLKHIGLGQVKQWYDALLGSDVGLIAVGGISAGQDIEDYRLLGADAFQMTTELLKGGDLDPRPFERVAAEYLEVGLSRVGRYV